MARHDGSSGKSGHERAIDLQDVDRQPLQVLDRRVAHSEVVEGGGDTVRSQAVRAPSSPLPGSAITWVSVSSRHTRDGSTPGRRALSQHLVDVAGLGELLAR